jgi:hypothetical protein
MNAESGHYVLRSPNEFLKATPFLVPPIVEV